MQRVNNPGFFIVLAGADCSGKTTNIPFLRDKIAEQGFEVVTCRDPGGTLMAEKIRHLILSENMVEDPISLRSELLLFGAARRQLVDSLIKPSLEQGKIVLCDRFFESTYAYQGHAKGLYEEVTALEREFFDDIAVDQYLYLDVSPEVAAARKAARQKEYNRLNAHEQAFHDRVTEGYRDWVFKNLKNDSLCMIDANQSQESVQSVLAYWVANHLTRLVNAKRERG